jgi:hypothetical protein
MTSDHATSGTLEQAGLTHALFDFNMPGCETIESALGACGWQARSVARSWTHGRGRNKATLIEMEETTGWRHFILRQSGPPRTTAQVLFDNFQLAGPKKLVARTGSAPDCRFDVPTEFIETDGLGMSAVDFSAVANPVLFWANVVTTGLAEQSANKMRTSNAIEDESVPATESATPLPAEQIAMQLQSAGWTATAEEGRVFVNVSLPGIFRQVEIADEFDDGIHRIVVGCNLVDLPDDEDEQDKTVTSADDAPSMSIDGSAKTQAIVYLAQQVNSRLPLVRMAIDTRNRPWRLRAEVCFCGGPIPGAWLTTAVETVQSAIAATALEFEALRRDAELANLVLAAAADGTAL